MAKNVLTQNLSEPLNGAKRAMINIDPGDGNLIIDNLTGSEPVLASGKLEYLEKQGFPTRSVDRSNGQAALTLKASGKGQPWFRLPWASCNGATEWQIHLNPGVPADITAHTDGGNIRVDLAGMVVTSLSVDTGGGNLGLVLPEAAANLSMTAKSGAGNVTVEVGNDTTGSNSIYASSGAGNVEVRLPGRIAARISATTGMGKAIMDARFNQIDKNTYETLDYANSADKVEITIKSGAGNVSVNTR